VDASPVSATFHLMQIEQVLGGVAGAAGVQAIQLRMRADFQDEIAASIIVVRDATGSNPIVVVDPDSDVPNDTLGSRILIASANFATTTSPPAVPDLVMSSPIPASYLAAGSLTFEAEPPFSLVYWRISWGGSGYTGPTGGALANDDDGDFGPPWPGALPSAGVAALQFQGEASAMSTTNAADYALTSGAVVFENNAGATFTVMSNGTDVPVIPVPLSDPRFVPNPFRSVTRLEFDLARRGRTRLVITDAAGRRVATVETDLPAGSHSLGFSATDVAGAPLASGVYFYRLEVEKAVRTGRVVLLR
jgi:hypothetical protein